MSFYTLHIKDRPDCIGVYTSIRHCEKGLDLYLANNPKDKAETFYYMEWEPNCNIPECWDWAYISPNAMVEDLKSCGSNYVPAKEYWGQNIIDTDWNDVG